MLYFLRTCIPNDATDIDYTTTLLLSKFFRPIKIQKFLGIMSINRPTGNSRYLYNEEARGNCGNSTDSNCNITRSSTLPSAGSVSDVAMIILIALFAPVILQSSLSIRDKINNIQVEYNDLLIIRA